jgi:hypothetical protein
MLIPLRESKNNITFAVGLQEPAREQHGEASKHSENILC